MNKLADILVGTVLGLSFRHIYMQTQNFVEQSPKLIHPLAVLKYSLMMANRGVCSLYSTLHPELLYLQHEHFVLCSTRT